MEKSSHAPVVAKLAATPEAYGKIWHFAGVGTTSQQAIIAEIEKQTGRKLKLRVAGKTLLRLVGLFNPMMREIVEMHYLLTEPVLMDDSALEKLIGPLHKTPYDEGVRQTLASIPSDN